jgi:two-component system, chemotaxis family, response regulator Rcp1
MTTDAIKILLVEDNPGDALLTRETLEGSKILHELFHVETGTAAMEFLRNQGEYQDAPRPDMMLLDLNLPGMDGREVLGEVKEDPILRRIPVVVLTSSQAEEDVVRSYNLHANAYVTKPVGLDGFAKIVAGIESFWWSIVSFAQD